MKIKNLILPCLIALGLCSCNFGIKSVSNISCDVTQTPRLTDDKFDLDDIKATLIYSDDSTVEVNFRSFATYNLSATCTDPKGNKSNTLTKDFVLETEGLYTIDVYYNPRSKYSFACSASDSFEVEKRYIPVTDLNLSSTSLTIREGEFGKLEYSMLPNNSTVTAPTFESNDETVATVDQTGNITAIKEGQCIITVKADDVKRECLITVIPTCKTEYIFTNSTFDSSEGNWIYSQEGYGFNIRQGYGVIVKNDTTIKSPLTFDKIGYIEFECTTGLGTDNGEEIGSITSFVNDEKIEETKFTEFNKTFKIKHEVNNLSGEVALAINPSSTEIYIKSVTIMFSNELVYPTSIELDGTSELGIGETGKITISFNPASTSERVIKWSSSDEEVLTIGIDGTICGLKEGSAIVTAQAMCEDGFYTGNTYTVTVIKRPVESVTFDDDSKTIEIFERETAQLTYTLLPDNASFKSVVFVSSNSNVATVDATGNIKGINAGECTITCKSTDDPSKFDICNVSILERPKLATTEMKYGMKDYTKNSAYEIDCAPSIGELRLLIIPLWFTDSSNYISSKQNVRSDIYASYLGTESETGWESVKTFYEKESGGKLSVTGTVSEWYECGESLSRYNYNTASNSSNTNTIVKKATDWYFKNNTSDSRKNYDYDGDGYLDGVIVIYGAPDYYALGSLTSGYNAGDNLWAYTYWLQNPGYKSTNNPGPNTYFWASYDFIYSSSALAKNRTGKSNYSSGGNERLSVDAHTYIHEMGHVFGLEDYYDYSGQCKPAGAFSMQDNNVGGHDPYSCLSLGWASAYIPKEDCEIELTPFQTSHEVILLTPEFNSYDSPFDEYILLELYTPTGLNKFDTDYAYNNAPRGVNATGIRLWHIDARLVTLDSYGRTNANKVYTRPVTDCTFMMSNTYYSNDAQGYITPCGKDYANYNQLQLIRNSTTSSYKANDDFKESYLFKNGSNFKMSTYKNQFVKSGKLNSGLSLGWTFTVSIDGSSDNAIALIKVTKEN